MKVAIIGAGIAGLIAEGACLKTFGNNIAVFDTKPEKGLSTQHKAVMRLRDTSIKEYVNCDLKKIKAQKAIFHNGEVYTVPNLLLNNLYSLKVYASIGDRSVLSLGSVDRYLISNIRSNNINYIREKVIKADTCQLILESGTEIEFDICISTIPMPKLLSMLGMEDEYDVKFSYTPIHVTRAVLDTRSTVNQTMYYTNRSDRVPYRVTIQGQDVIAESIYPIKNIGNALKAFGLDYGDLKEESIISSKQEFGKIEPIDDNLRRRILMDITDDYKIYSLGRFATWRSLRVDQVVEDIKKIIMLIKVKHKAYYINHGEN